MTKRIKQDTLLLMEKHHLVENVQRTLFDMALRLKNQELQLPEFQREFVWSNKQVEGWIDSIIKGNAIGVIVTYQSTKTGDGYAMFLADGFQRLTATMRFLENPFAYKYEFGPEQAKIYCEAFSITVQHRLYGNHFEAMNAFQKLNSGTALTPHEFYRGELALFSHGKLVVNKIPDIVHAVEKPFLVNRGLSHKALSKATRDSYALFYQYITKTKATTFWNIQTNEIGSNKSNIVERLLEKELRALTTKEINNLIANFETFLFDQTAIWKKFLESSGNSGKAISLTVVRWLMHVGVWRKNVSQSVGLYNMFLERLFEEYRKYTSITARVIIPNKHREDGFSTIKYVSMSMNGIMVGLTEFGEAFEIPIHKIPKRKTNKKAAVGYNESHLMPFSIHGNGETIIEPASINKSRGANEI